jgi:hypothetical protein
MLDVADGFGEEARGNDPVDDILGFFRDGLERQRTPSLQPKGPPMKGRTGVATLAVLVAGALAAPSAAQANHGCATARRSLRTGKVFEQRFIEAEGNAG